MNVINPFYKSQIRKITFFIPFTVYFFAFFLGAVALGRLLYKKDADNNSSFSDIFSLLLKVFFGFAGVIICASLVLVLISWIYFIYKKNKAGITLQIDTDKQEDKNNEARPVYIFIKPILKPILGFVKIRLLYDKTYFSKKFSLLENKNASPFSNNIEGIYHWALPEIKEYRLEGAIIYFEDIFQFFSLAIRLNVNSNFFSLPVQKTTGELNVSPKKTEETNIRIEQMRKVEGEFLNYKNFENNDDVRRIVWKIYAKNKELVVRLPEIMDPYASHVYIYPSFHSSFNITGNEVANVTFLNFYKTIIWSVYQSLARLSLEIKYVPDQDLSGISIKDEQERVKHLITISHWQTKKNLKDFIENAKASVAIVSSLNDPAEVQELYDRFSNEIHFIFIKLTDCFKDQQLSEWLQWIFIKNQQHDSDVFKRKWMLSNLKEKIKENERMLEEILESVLT